MAAHATGALHLVFRSLSPEFADFFQALGFATFGLARDVARGWHQGLTPGCSPSQLVEHQVVMPRRSPSQWSCIDVPPGLSRWEGACALGVPVADGRAGGAQAGSRCRVTDDHEVASQGHRVDTSSRGWVAITDR